MTKELCRDLIKEIIKNKNESTILLLTRILFESEQAKQELRNKGYGWTGLSLLETVRQEVSTKEKLVMSFEEIPEDKKESHPCPDCKEGNVGLNFDETKWECDTCNWEYEIKND